MTIVIDTPPRTKTDRGVGDGSSVAAVRTAYGKDHKVEIIETAAGSTLVVAPLGKDVTRDPTFGFAISGSTVGPPMVGGIPGFEYCSG